MESSDVSGRVRWFSPETPETCPYLSGKPREPGVAHRTNVRRVRRATERRPLPIGGDGPPPPRRSGRPSWWRRRCRPSRASFPRAGACRTVNSGACRVPSGRRRRIPVQARPNRCDQGCRSDWWPCAGRRRGNRWGTDSCQRRQRRRNVHVVPDTSEESASLALSAVQYRFLGPLFTLIPSPPARSAHAFGSGHLHGSSSRPAHRARTPLPPPRTALPWQRRNTRP